jgi:two-component system CheB/CheR fusion protein
MSKKRNPEPEHHTQNFPVIGIGASAGGLNAFRKFLRSIPPNPGMAFIFVQHLSPTHESILPEILAQETLLPVHEIQDDINIAPNHVYIIPENKMLTAIDGKLRLETRNEALRNKIIDKFFTSLAEVHDSFARGVILTGSGFDGTQGLLTIKEKGGTTFVQNPDTADFDSMPRNAIKSGAADFVLEIEEIAEHLQHVNTAYETNHAHDTENELVPKTDEDIFKQIIRLLRLRTGNDFTHYKQPTIRRRIARRMVLTKLEDPAIYLNFLRNNKQEQDALFNDILIPVSYFFRDTKIFDILKATVFPLILQKRLAEESIRVWVAGCSTGEEAYTIAILLHEFLAEKQLDAKVQIFASDISENVVNKARAAIYTRQEVQNVSDSRLSNYFSKAEGVYHINKEIRDMCVFAVHNFVKDPPFAKMDLITCRNVLIYLDPYLQKKALTTFHYALKNHGVLFLGKSETASQMPNLFEQLVKHHKIYTKKILNGQYIAPSFERVETTSPDKQVSSRKKAPSEPDFQKLASDILFSKYTPAGVIINEGKEIVHFHGDTTPFLLPPPGKPNFNIYKMIREGLAFELRNALLKAKESQETVIKESVPIKGKEYLVNIEVVPLTKSLEPHFLVLFHKNMLPLTELQNADNKKTAEQERIRQLEEEIEQMRDDIRRVTEDQEAANEELQSANEELLSNSEELQTLNEELETSAEELQSNNEELITVNDELMDRQEQLIMARMYSEAIVETVREPLIVLDSEMRVKSANVSFYRFFRTTEHDTEGRLIFDLNSGQWNTKEFRDGLYAVLHKTGKIEDFEITAFSPETGERTMLVSARLIKNDNVQEQLVLLALEDITAIRAANAMLLQNNRELEENNKDLSSFSYIASHDLQEPLRKIYTFAKLLFDNDKDKLSETSQAYLERILVSTDRMQQLIDDLLNYSHLNSLNDVAFAETDLSLTMAEVLGDIEERIIEKKAKISVADLPTVKGRATLLHQLFINLISNSLKYGKPATPPEITITSQTVSGREISLLGGDPNTHFHKIVIKDNGIGFRKEQAQIIFEPFKRLHSKDKFEGSGIGLAICSKIAIKHKGFITAESDFGKGAAFNIYLPV